MSKLSELYKAEATSPYKNVTSSASPVGFRIPEYQRQYDWSEDNIDRLFMDVLNGFSRLSENASAASYTFLGAVVMVEEDSYEPTFDGLSLAIVDGQQRLTTLVLFACALYLQLEQEVAATDFMSLKDDEKNWLEEELKVQLGCLYACAIGTQHIPPDESYPFPRIVRAGDIRANSNRESEYKSPIAKFLHHFCKHVKNSDGAPFNMPDLKHDVSGQKITARFHYIQEALRLINQSDWYSEAECEIFDVEKTVRKQVRELFRKLKSVFPDKDREDKAVARIANNEQVSNLLRLFLFSRYFCDYIVFTKVVTKDEGAAFDIFDALNTTGEPLTALETLKPRIIQFENSCSRYVGSESEAYWSKLNELIDKRFEDTKKKQSETKDLVVSFALYQDGKKESKELAGQRIFLRNSFDTAVSKGHTSARDYIKALSKLAEFRRYYWENDGISKLGLFHTTETVNDAQFLSQVIKDLKTSMALPVLCRFWSTDLASEGDSEFIEALRATVAFIVLRRSYTGGTDGIDGVFRDIMAPANASNSKYGFCAAQQKEISVSELKEIYLKLLHKKLKVFDRENWVSHVSDNPLYKQSRELSRFLIFAAAHGAANDDVAGLLTREDIKFDQRNDYLNYNLWTSELYSTVEHVAPDSAQVSGWDYNIYLNQRTRHTLGNLTLLPQNENSSISDSSWEKKRLIYLCLTEKTKAKQLERIAEAERNGLRLSAKLKQQLDERGVLALLESLRGVEEWTEELVKERSKNIASLGWDTVRSWLD
ncbi:hypothetical protein C9928_00690 [Pseudidiomarina aestuarii]|uniref:Uncharacterized protein n=1 Tax=Pseudidiomarina aestuarii TaxID=624146 RepID=A0A2T4CTF1_9GAMM|nr:hypothetical protein C9988_03695 [Pseudidiomarina aestuarii]PTB90271.1 hypothetical protein C9928_00690 [Pseudidiomarina aestuarii]